MKVYLDVEDRLAEAEHALHVEGDLRASRRRFDDAYLEADAQGDGPSLARAALGLGGVWVHEHRTATAAGLVRARQHRALSVIDPHSSLAFRLRARLCAEEDYRTGGHAAILDLLAQARGVGDPVAVAETLSLAHHCVLGPHHGALRLDLAEELIGQAPCTARRGDLLMGLMWRTVDLFLNGDPHAERSLEELRGLLAEEDHLAVGFVASAMDTMLSIRAGRFTQAQELAGRCGERGVEAGDIDALGWFCEQLGTVRWYQGRFAELVPVLSELVNSPMLSAVDHSYVAALAVAAAAAGERRLAVGMLARLRAMELPHSSSWMITVHCQAEAAHLLQDADAAAHAYALLSPFADLPVMSSLAIACLGSAHHALGMAALTIGDLDRAVDHFEQAVHANLALGHWPAAVLSRWRLGQVLARRDGQHDQRARREQAGAQQEAAHLGMVLPGSTAPPRSQGACRRQGRYWQVELGGKAVLVEHSVGMRHLATLMANPGREIRALDLAAGPGAAEGIEEAAHLVLDEQARRTYKQRLSQVRAEIDELEAMHDLERAASLRAEREWLLAELAAATGMNGRTRQFAGTEERARIAVGKAIRRALTRIEEADPAIGEALRATLHTGQRCCYRP